MRLARLHYEPLGRGEPELATPDANHSSNPPHVPRPARPPRLERRSFKLLDEVSKVIVNHPELKHLRVEGHTDDRGNDAYNKKLSQARAESVMRYLTEHGVAAERLVAVGYGEEKPVADNTTENGRTKNRRVEFKIIDASAATKE